MNLAHSQLPKAVIWDLDGTLYRQAPLRKRMLWELAKAGLRQSPASSAQLFRWLKIFREEREKLRALGQPTEALERLQFERPAGMLGTPVAPFEARIREWMWNRPLPFLESAVYDDVRPVLSTLHDAAVPMAVFSDYPVSEKLQALGLASFFTVQVCATDSDINAFKPHPRGFQVAAEKLGVAPSDVLFIGDRMAVDGMGAQAAGMDYRILDRVGSDPRTLRNYHDLAQSWLDSKDHDAADIV